MEQDERFFRPLDEAAVTGGLLRQRLIKTTAPWASLFTVVFCTAPSPCYSALLATS